MRDVLRYYKNHDDPIEAFRENQRKLQVFAYFNSLDISNTRKPLSSNIFVIIVHVSCHNITKFFNRRHWRQKRNHKKRSKVKAGCFHPVYPPSEDLGDNKCFLLEWLSHVTHVTNFGKETIAPKTKKATSIYIS